ncbi:MAG: DUF6266 family protein [Bacteroidales bacterium]|nr:DUF6266 family protein [Bacteroidales bacterium]
MAIVINGFSGPFIGRLGPAVGYMWKQHNCVRSYRPHINYPNTEQQREERDWFVGMVRFAAQARKVLKMGLARQAAEARMTEGNYFVMRNKQHFVRVEGRVEVDYSRLVLSAGPAADVYFHEPHFEEDETVAVDFEKNSSLFHGSLEDEVYLYAYVPSLGRGLLSAPVPRRRKRVAIRLPEAWNGTEVHLYGFVVDRDGRPSNSTYIGMGRVDHYQYEGRYVPLNKNWSEFLDIASEANAEQHPAADSPVAKEAEVPVIDLFGDPPEVP